MWLHSPAADLQSPALGRKERDKEVSYRPAWILRPRGDQRRSVQGGLGLWFWGLGFNLGFRVGVILCLLSLE